MATAGETAGNDPRPGRATNIALWVAQVLVAVPFVFFGQMKLLNPITQLSQMMHWTAEYPEAFVRTMGLVDIAGGVGILLPALLRIRPGVTVAAAAGCAALQICAIVFHTSRGEAMLTPMNYVFLALSIFVLWGRSRRAPIRARV